MITLVKLLVMVMPVFAQGRANLYTRPEAKIEENRTSGRSLESDAVKRTALRSVLADARRAPAPAVLGRVKASGNLDSEILVVNSKFMAEDSAVIVPSSPKGIKLRGLRIGDVIHATIPESLIAFPDAKAPVRAKVSFGPLKGSIFLGEATLEKNTKRILIDFKKCRLVKSDEDYQLLASVLDSGGVLGVEGKYESQESKFFLGQFLAAGAAGYADATIERNQNAYGNYVDAPTVDTASKKALGSALTKTAERFADRIKSAPEFSKLEGPVEVQILITAGPTLVD